MPRLIDRLLRPFVRGAYRLVRRRVRTRIGVHAVALTPERRLILVRLRYAPGWRLPGGGRSEREDPRDAVMRELREELGMTSHGDVHAHSEELLLVEDVRYRARRWSWEVEEIGEFALDAMPPGISPITARWLAEVRAHLSGGPGARTSRSR
jgi:ADP-ribose pyrophosphatase YjhB (NUDIX family)